MSISQALTFATWLRDRKVERRLSRKRLYGIRQMPIEADGRIRYRMKSQVDKTKRVVTEEELSIVPLGSPT